MVARVYELYNDRIHRYYWCIIYPSGALEYYLDEEYAIETATIWNDSNVSYGGYRG